MPPAFKKRKLEPAPEVISFDTAAREEYLTGFHKRKVARIKHAQEETAKKEREEKIRIRAELRKQRKEDLEKHVTEVNRLVKQANGELTSSFEGDGSSDDEEVETSEPHVALNNADGDESIDEEASYNDEDKYTTVTIESVGITRSGFETKSSLQAQQKEEKEANERREKEKRVWTKEKPKTSRSKKKKIKFRYETKAERKAERVKQGIRKKKLREKRMGSAA